MMSHVRAGPRGLLLAPLGALLSQATPLPFNRCTHARIVELCVCAAVPQLLPQYDVTDMRFTNIDELRRIHTTAKAEVVNWKICAQCAPTCLQSLHV